MKYANGHTYMQKEHKNGCTEDQNKRRSIRVNVGEDKRDFGREEYLADTA